MQNKTKTLILILPVIFLLIHTTSFGYELERNEAFTKNKFLQLQPNGEVIDKIRKDIKPDIKLKGATDEEEREMLAAFYELGYLDYLIYFVYALNPLNSKIGKSNLKEVIILNLRKVRDLMAEVEADEKLLELNNQISNRIEKENINAKQGNKETLALINELSNRIGTHIENTFGQSYKIYYRFGRWTSQVMTLCDVRIVYDETMNTTLTKKERENLWDDITKELKNLLELANTYKSQVKDLTNKAVSRNLENLYETALEIKGIVEVSTAKRLYNYSQNVYYGIIPKY